MSLGQKHPGIHSIPVFSRQSVWLHSVDSAVSTTRFSLWPGKWPAAVEHGTGMAKKLTVTVDSTLRLQEAQSDLIGRSSKRPRNLSSDQHWASNPSLTIPKDLTFLPLFPMMLCKFGA